MVRILLGKLSEDGWNDIIRESALIGDTGSRIDFLSSKFLGADYAESTLTGGKDAPEVFIINLRGVDCFTFLEYVEAMGLSESFSGFKENLRKVRYRSGIVSFENRNHFFTDWREFNKEFIEDVTEKIGGPRTVKVQKVLNGQENGTHILPGIRPVKRDIAYIPSESVDDRILKELRTGDYTGIYSDVKGLDVSHVGIFTRDGDSIFLRHASSQKEYRKVVDQDFREYIAHKPGIIVLRPSPYYP